jgi:hypothetical protein
VTTAIARRDDRRDPAKASGRCRKAAEHYVKGGCKAIGPSLVWAGFSPHTASDPTRNGYSHDWLVEVARYWNKGSQVTARAYLNRAIGALGAMVDDPQVAPQARGAAAKTLIDVAAKEREQQDTVEVAAEEQAKWMNLIRHWKRTFLRRGLRMGLLAEGATTPLQRDRPIRLLAELDWVLGKGPLPDWMKTEEETDGEGVQRPEGGPRPETDGDAEILEADIISEETIAGTGPTDPE